MDEGIARYLRIDQSSRVIRYCGLDSDEFLVGVICWEQAKALIEERYRQEETSSYRYIHRSATLSYALSA